MKKRWLVPSIVVGLALMLAAPAWADLQDRFDAYKREVFEADLKELPSSALQGDAEAQGQAGVDVPQRPGGAAGLRSGPYVGKPGSGPGTRKCYQEP